MVLFSGMLQCLCDCLDLDSNNNDKSLNDIDDDNNNNSNAVIVCQQTDAVCTLTMNTCVHKGTTVL